jgi:hypothetical protein
MTRNKNRYGAGLDKLQKGSSVWQSSLLYALIDKTPTVIPVKNVKYQRSKSSTIPTPKASKMTVEAKAAVHPFILEHRVGTTERVTSMNPLSKEFISSLRIPFKGRYSTKPADTEETPHSIMESIVFQHKSKLMIDAVSAINRFVASSLSSLCRPWDENGWINPSFRINSAFILDHQGSISEFEAGKLMLEPWMYREPDFVCTTEYENLPVRATLINKFEAIPDRLVCYSFIAKYRSQRGDMLGGDQSLVHFWVNRTYIEQGQRLLPMYFEDAGSFTFILNAVTACLGLDIDATGEVGLTVHSSRGVRHTKLNARQVGALMQMNALINFSNVGHSNAPMPWNKLVAGDWQGIGYDLQPGGAVWNLSAAVSHLPWSVQDQRRKMAAATTIRRVGAIVGKTAGGARAIFDHPLENRKAMISESIGEIFWDKIRNSEAATEFDGLLKELRTEHIGAELVDELKRLHPEISANELLKITLNRSDEIGRFVFERSLPSVSSS